MCSQLATPVMAPFCSLVRPWTVSSWHDMGTGYELVDLTLHAAAPPTCWHAPYLAPGLLQHLGVLHGFLNFREHSDLARDGY